MNATLLSETSETSLGRVNGHSHKKAGYGSLFIFPMHIEFRGVSMPRRNHESFQFPVVIEKDEDGYFIVECPVLEGCYTQGKSVDEALKNIKEVIALCMQENETRDFLKTYRPVEFSFHTVSIGA